MAYEETKNDSSKKMNFLTPTKYKKNFPLLKEVNRLALANAQLTLDRAYQNFFRDKSIGFPRFKSKKNPFQSYTMNNKTDTVALIDNKFIKVPKVKSLIIIKLHRQPKGIIKSATISRRSSGKYYVRLLCKEEVNELPKTNSAIAIDLGITDFAILSFFMFLGIETIQYLFYLGTFSLGDIFLNVSGTTIDFYLYKKILSDHSQ